MKKDIFIGVILGLIANTIGTLLFALYVSKTQHKTIENVFEIGLAEGSLGKMISIGAVLNLLAFFGLLRQGQDARAKGVLLVTIAVAIITMLLLFN